MKLWIDAQLSPALAPWMQSTLGVEASSVKALGMRDAEDLQIFLAARAADAAILTKDADFADLVLRHGAPPQVLWLTAGNTSNARVRELLTKAWPRVVQLLEQREALIELRSLS